MWIRATAGVALCALGGVWIAQGSGAMHGSMMTGHGRYTTLGGLAVLIGLALIGWSLLVLRRTGRHKRLKPAGSVTGPEAMPGSAAATGWACWRWARRGSAVPLDCGAARGPCGSESWVRAMLRRCGAEAAR